MSTDIKEKRYSDNLNYTLEDDSIFYEVGYKVLQSQANSGFIKCTRVMHNGKIKLVYNISKYKDLESVIRNSNTDIFLRIITNLLRVAIEVKGNGFIEYRNIITNFNSIFIDANNFNIYYIYIPVNLRDGRGERNFVDELKQNLLSSIEYNRNLSGFIINNLRVNLTLDKTLEEILKEINNNKINVQPKVSTNEIIPPSITQIPPVRVEEPSTRGDKKKSRGMFGGIFSTKNKNNDISRREDIISENSYDEEDDDSDSETSLLMDDSSYGIALNGINTPVDISFKISAKEFVIGSKADYADGVISFNKAISRKHCKIITIDDNYYIMDLGSSNGTFVNGSRLDSNCKVDLNIGDLIKIANSEFMVVKTI